MSTAQVPPTDQAATTATRRGGPNRAAERARARRSRRQATVTATRVVGAGKPVRSALSRVPFVIALIAILASGVGGVLYLNTKIDESGMRAEQAKSTAAQLRLAIEELGRTVADLGATPRLATEAAALGLIPSGDAAIMTIDGAGKATVLGTPAPAGDGESQAADK